jgi:hypothetical protein
MERRERDDAAEVLRAMAPLLCSVTTRLLAGYAVRGLKSLDRGGVVGSEASRMDREGRRDDERHDQERSQRATDARFRLRHSL